jgi:hypothetical protein
LLLGMSKSLYKERTVWARRHVSQVLSIQKDLGSISSTQKRERERERGRNFVNWSQDI